ncbi:hypothetical protein HPB52_019053 [Rhipicephalus sanguineus]|uniref:Uncharacterized protein n=1 Tax=Rhipicephalus sanguineus TaxID=34632 RepID=A0A9D4PKB7_RHISA|nr:hypothetical protein HPB52_019053 [Rhipicephalus sanguineus]
MGDVLPGNAGERQQAKAEAANGCLRGVLAGLSGIDEFDSRNTLIQIFDADLEDFVDLMPGDVVPHKARHQIAPRSPASPEKVFHISRQGDQLHYSIQSRRLSRVTEDLRAMLPDHLVTDDVKQLVPNSAIIPKHEHDRNDYLKFELPSSFGVWCDIALERKTLITPKLRRHIITVLFQACYKISLYPTMRLYRRAIDALMVKYPHIAEGPFNWQCWCLALRSKFKNTRRKLPETPGIMGESRRKFGGKRTLEDVRYQALGVDEPLESSMSADSHGQSGGDASVGMEAMAFKVEPDQQSSEAMSDCSNFNSAELEDVTVSDLLSTCTDEAATEKLVDQAGGRALADGNTNGGELSLEGRPSRDKRERPSLKDRDDMKFELPSFGVFEDALEMRQPVTNRLRRHITRCLFDACSKITLYPTSHLYRTAVDLLLHKYPHLIDTTGETGRLLADFKMLWNADIPECFERASRGCSWCDEPGTKDEMEKFLRLETGSTLPTPCLVQRPTGTSTVVNGFYSAHRVVPLGGMCVLFASFWVFHIEYPKGGRNILTFLEHAFLNLRHMKPRLKCWELINRTEEQTMIQRARACY